MSHHRRDTYEVALKLSALELLECTRATSVSLPISRYEARYVMVGTPDEIRALLAQVEAENAHPALVPSNFPAPSLEELNVEPRRSQAMR